MDMKLTPAETALLAKDDRDARRFGHWMQTILGLVGASALILLVQAYTWLRTGNWPPLSLRDAVERIGMTPKPSSWVGLERIADAFWSLPLSGALFCLAMGAIFWITRGDQKEIPEALRQARMKQARLRNP